jgi:protocatechuate 3,4-dioxygenase beta subunit
MNDALSKYLTRVSRRALLGRAAKAGALLVVSQPLISCSSDLTSTGDNTNDDGNDGTQGSVGCVLTAALTEGPYFVDEKLNRSDIRTDPTSGAVSQGTPLDLTFNVSRVASSACTPLTGAYLDVWHCDATGTYSDVTGAVGRKFLRGYQITDGSGVAKFTTIYPGWYTGRAVHVHFKLRLFTGSTTSYEFTSQFFFNEAVTTTVYGQSPYNSRGTRDTLNSNDNIYNSLSSSERTALTLQTSQNGNGYSGVIGLGVQLV